MSTERPPYVELPPPAWAQNDAYVRTHLEELSKTFDDAFQSFIEELDTSFFGKLRSRLEQVQGVHEALMQQLPEEGEESPTASPETLWKAIHDYKETVTDEVLAPLNEVIGTENIAQALSDRSRLLLRQQLRDAAKFPENLTRLAPIAWTTPLPEDDFWTCVEKSRLMRRQWGQLQWRRLRNWGRRITGRAPIQWKPIGQVIPFQQVVRHHIRTRILPILHELYDQALSQAAHPISTLEAGLTEWTHVVLQVERDLDRPIFHVPPSYRPKAGEHDAAEIDAAGQPNRLALVRNAVRQFQQVLHTAATYPPTQTLIEPFKERIKASQQALQNSVDLVGSPLFDETTLIPSQTESPFEQHLTKAGAAWTSWHQRARNRLKMNEELFRFEKNLEQLQDTYLEEVGTAGLQPIIAACEQASTDLEELDSKATNTFVKARKDSAIQEGIQTILDSALQTVEKRLTGLFGEQDVKANIQKAAQEATETMSNLLAKLPAQFQVNRLHQTEERRTPPFVEARLVNLRLIGEQALNMYAIDEIQKAINPMLQAVSQAEKEADDVRGIILSYLETAINEISSNGEAPAAPTENPDAEEDEEKPKASPLELTLDGLSKSRDQLTVDKFLKVPRLAMAAMAEAVCEPCQKGWDEMRKSASIEESSQESLDKFLTKVRIRLWDMWKEVRKTWEDNLNEIRTWLRKRRRQLLVISRFTQSVLGIEEEAPTGDIGESLSSLLTLNDKFARLPLVYQHSFAFGIHAKPSLAYERKDDTQQVLRHLEQWKRGRTNALIINGHFGAGHSSFLNMLKEGLFKDESVLAIQRVVQIELQERDLDEQAFGKRIAEAMNWDDQTDYSLQAIRNRILEEPATPQPLLVTIEHLEHLFLRTIDDLALIEKVLMFFSQTDARVIWIGTITDYGWLLINKTMPAANLVSGYALKPIDRNGLQALILNRHRSSGIGLVFKTPDPVPPMLHRKLSKAKNEDEQQEALSNHYFDKLAQACGQNIALAMFYWIRSVHEDPSKEHMIVHPLKPLQFRFFNQFDLNHAFTLKAFLEHSTLTIWEHRQIFGFRHDESLEIFESLANQLLIHPAGQQPTNRPISFALVDENARYSIHPFLIHPVTHYLREEKKIVY